jgi:hypothetical protein
LNRPVSSISSTSLVKHRAISERLGASSIARVQMPLAEPKQAARFVCNETVLGFQWPSWRSTPIGGSRATRRK